MYKATKKNSMWVSLVTKRAGLTSTALLASCCLPGCLAPLSCIRMVSSLAVRLQQKIRTICVTISIIQSGWSISTVLVPPDYLSRKIQRKVLTALHICTHIRGQEFWLSYIPSSSFDYDSEPMRYHGVPFIITSLNFSMHDAICVLWTSNYLVVWRTWNLV